MRLQDRARRFEPRWLSHPSDEREARGTDGLFDTHESIRQKALDGEAHDQAIEQLYPDRGERQLRANELPTRSGLLAFRRPRGRR